MIHPTSGKVPLEMSKILKRAPLWLRMLIVGAAALVGVGLTAACGNTASAMTYTPPNWGPMYMGQQYCVWEVTSLECLGHPGIPMQMPYSPYSVMPGAGSLAWSIASYHWTYGEFYDTSYYYDHYVYVHHSHTTINVSRTTFVNTASKFDSKYSSQEKTYEAKAKWRGSNGKTVSESAMHKAKPKQFSGGNAKNAKTGGNGSTAGPRSTSKSKTGSGSNSGSSGKTKSKTGSGSGTSGKSRSGSGFGSSGRSKSFTGGSSRRR